MRKSLVSRICLASFLGLILLLVSQVAIAQEADQDEIKQEDLANLEEKAEKGEMPLHFVSDGSTFQVESLAISINPPPGWEVFTKKNGLSIVLQAPKPEVPETDYETPIFQRNITVAAVHKPAPIDKARAELLGKELAAAFEKDALVSEFQVLETKFFDYRGKNDGILVYSAMKLGEFNMMQMHVLVSGDSRQFLMTYTDLEENFRKQDTPDFQTAWASMMSLQVTGKPPVRYEELIKYGSLGGGLLFILLIVGVIRHRSATKDYMREADTIYHDEGPVLGESHSNVYTSQVWNLSGTKKTANSRYEEKDDFMFSDITDF